MAGYADVLVIRHPSYGVITVSNNLFIDTVQMMAGYADVLVIRHPSYGVITVS